MLSVGQKRKIRIARLLAVRANVLLLDEPTNHISLDVLEEFEAAPARFEGPIVAVSHDRRYAGGWDEYRTRTSAGPGHWAIARTAGTIFAGVRPPPRPALFLRSEES